MKKAPNIVITISGGRSRLLNRLAGVQPDPLQVEDGLREDRAATDHGAEVEAEEGDDGISELRSTWWIGPGARCRPLARAVRT